MSGELFENNLQILQSRYPDYAKQIRSLTPSPTQPIDPSHVQSWLKRTLDPAHRQVILLGLAGGCPIPFLQRDYGLHFLAIIENSFQRLATAMGSCDLREALQDESVHWLIGCPPPYLKQGLLYIKSQLAAHGFQVIRTPTAHPSDKIYYDAILQELPGIIERETFSLKALLARGVGVQSNLVRNFPAILDSSPLDAVVGQFAQKPAIVVAAGPSLDKNVHLLSHLNDRAILLCVDTAVKTLLPLGIHPHIVVTSDPTPENALHFKQIEIPEKTVLAYAPDGCPEILTQYEHHSRKLCLFDNSNWFNEHLRKLLHLRSLLPRPMHVGETAIRLAIAMGCDPIIFVGLDLALPRDAKATHAQASARALPIVSLENNQAQVQNEVGGISAQNLFPVPGIDGLPVSTYYSFKMYLQDLERIVADTPVRWIDATEGGALKPGCALQTLEETLAQLNENLEIERQVQSWFNIEEKNRLSCLESMHSGFLRLQSLEADLQRITEDAMSLEDASIVWDTLLTDKEIRAFIDHAIYPFQLHPRLNKISQEERVDFLRARAREALPTVRILMVFWQDAFSKCAKKEGSP